MLFVIGVLSARSAARRKSSGFVIAVAASVAFFVDVAVRFHRRLRFSQRLDLVSNLGGLLHILIGDRLFLLSPQTLDLLIDRLFRVLDLCVVAHPQDIGVAAILVKPRNHGVLDFRDLRFADALDVDQTFLAAPLVFEFPDGVDVGVVQFCLQRRFQVKVVDRCRPPRFRFRIRRRLIEQWSVVIVYIISGAVAAWAFEIIRRADRQRSEAEAALVAERTERARAEERSALAARIHDSVLQTLALIQREGDDPRRVRQLARRQERELRASLFGPGDRDSTSGLRDALADMCAEIEELTGITATLIVVGAAEPSPGVDTVAKAAREAIVNAAKYAGVDQVSVYGEAGEEGISVFVRDRGSGFVLDDVDQDRRGIADSIVGRMERAGGTAEVITEPGKGTEVRLHLPFVPVGAEDD